MTAILDAGELVTMMPERLNAFLEKLANNELSFNIEALDEKYLMTGFQKIANRLTTGLILAALIVGAALMMNFQTRFMIWGYPGFAMIAFLIAGSGGLILIFKICFRMKRPGVNNKLLHSIPCRAGALPNQKSL
jgi:ubiquinone biosynthesis protein